MSSTGVAETTVFRAEEFWGVDVAEKFMKYYCINQTAYHYRFAA